MTRISRHKDALTFIDLFAGIGGFRFAFQAAGCECVYSSEWDPNSCKTYEAFFGNTPDWGDITKLHASAIPRHNVLAAGFPCQPFSLAGVSKKNALGRKHGFEDKTQGTLFFELARILDAKRPDAFVLENVKNLQSHNGGLTFQVIGEVLHELEYDYLPRVVDSRFWVPQHRERIYIVGFRKDMDLSERLPQVFPCEPKKRGIELDGILEPPAEIARKYGDRYMLGRGTWEALRRHQRHHARLGNGFGYGLIEPPFRGKITRTLSARYHKDGAEILIHQPNKARPRRLTPLEVCRLQGFPISAQEHFDGTHDAPVSDTQAYRQFGNAVTVPVVREIAQRVADVLSRRSV